MSGNTPLPLLPNTPPARHPDTSKLDSAFDEMLLDHSIDAGCDFISNWGVADTEEAMVVSSINKTRLKDCMVAVLALVLGIPTVHPTQLEACYCLLHPHPLNYLVVVHQTGRGEKHILQTLGVIEWGIILILLRCSHSRPM